MSIKYFNKGITLKKAYLEMFKFKHFIPGLPNKLLLLNFPAAENHPSGQKELSLHRWKALGKERY